MLSGLPRVEVEEANKWMRIKMRLLNYCLNWLRDELIEEPIAIIVTPKHRHKIIKLNHCMLWMPEKIEPTIRTLKLTQFLDFENPHRIKLKSLERMLKGNLSECEIRIEKLEDGMKVIRIVWPIDVELAIDKDIILTQSRQDISPTQSLVTLLTYKPDWISARYTQHKEAFYKRLPLGFEEKKLVVYEGVESSCILNENGRNYLHVKQLDELRKSDDFIKAIPHKEGYDHWKMTVEQYLF